MSPLNIFSEFVVIKCAILWSHISTARQPVLWLWWQWSPTGNTTLGVLMQWSVEEMLETQVKVHISVTSVTRIYPTTSWTMTLMVKNCKLSAVTKWVFVCFITTLTPLSQSCEKMRQLSHVFVLHGFEGLPDFYRFLDVWVTGRFILKYTDSCLQLHSLPLH